MSVHLIKHPLILVIDNKQSSRQLLLGVLEELGECASVINTDDALRFLGNNSVDLIVVTISPSDLTGIDFCKSIKQEYRFSNIPVIFVAPLLGPDTEHACWMAGGSDIITNPTAIDSLRIRIERLLQQQLSMQHVRKNSFYDSVSGLFTEEYFAQEVDELYQFVSSTGIPFSLVVIEVSGIALVQALSGFIKGNRVVQELASILLSIVIKPLNKCMCIKGSVFIISLPGVNKEAAKLYKLRAEKALASHMFSSESSLPLSLQFKFGIACSEGRTYKNVHEVLEDYLQHGSQQKAWQYLKR